MDWIIESKDESSGRISENHYTTEESFRVALRDILGGSERQFISATLPDGKVLDGAAAKALLVSGGFSIGESGIGETPIE